MSKTNQIKVKQHKENSNKTGAICKLTSITNPESGLTIVFARLGARMVGVSLAWCAPEDEFKRKAGIAKASHSILYGEPEDFQFQVPMPGATNDQIVFQLTKMFQGQDFGDYQQWACEGIYQQNEIN